MIEVTFLGTGAAIPAPGQTNCAYIIKMGDVKLLFDCGPAILQQFAAVGRSPAEVTHVFISHGHGDHALGWPMFLLYLSLESKEREEAGLPPRRAPRVLASAPTWEHLDALWEHAYSDAPALPLDRVVLDAAVPGDMLLTPEIRIRTWPMIHSTRFPVLGLRIETQGKVIAFTADSARCDAIVDLARGADLLVHDARHALTVPPRREVQSRFHCAARDAGEYAAQAGARSLALVHIGAEYNGKQPDLVREAGSMFQGHVFAPVGGDVVRV